MMFKSRVGEDHICGECLASPKKFRIARAAGVYAQSILAVIHCLKYKGKIQLARPLGLFLFSEFIRVWNENSIDLIIPVPLHEKKHRMRGFNQSFLLIKNWPRLTEELDVGSPGVQVDRNVLKRNRWTEPQTGLGRKKRMQNIKNAFSITDSSKVVDKRVLLVDDVYTTGLTVNECATVLLRSGALNVDVLTLARAM